MTARAENAPAELRQAIERLRLAGADDAAILVALAHMSGELIADLAQGGGDREVANFMRRMRSKARLPKSGEVADVA